MKWYTRYLEVVVPLKSVEVRLLSSAPGALSSVVEHCVYIAGVGGSSPSGPTKTYVLLDKNGNFYIGYSSNIKNRLKEHKIGRVFATKTKLPIKLIYYEACLNRYDAYKREKYLKSGPGRKFIKHRLQNFLKPRAS